MVIYLLYPLSLFSLSLILTQITRKARNQVKEDVVQEKKKKTQKVKDSVGSADSRRDKMTVNFLK